MHKIGETASKMGWREVAILLVLQALAVSAENVTEEATAQMEALPLKPFGVGLGPTFIGGRDTDKAGTDLSLKIYKQFLQYKNLLFATPPNDKAYYDRYLILFYFQTAHLPL